MHPSRLLAGTARLPHAASPVSRSRLAPRAFRTAVAYALLASTAAGTAACSSSDAAAAKRDVRGGDAMVAAPTAHTPAGANRAAPGSDARSTAGGVSRTIVATASDTLLASADVYAGWRNFNINCQSCHGFNAIASDAAPDLRNSVRQGGTLTRAQFHEVVRKGRMAKGMPAWGALLDEKQIDQIYAYLRARSTGALGAGRPEVSGE